MKATALYERIQAVLDYISGMTDVFALDLYRKSTETVCRQYKMRLSARKEYLIRPGSQITCIRLVLYKRLYMPDALLCQNLINGD